MKAIKLLVALLFLGNIALAQNKDVDAIFEKYGNNDAFTVVNIGPDMFLAIDGKGDKDMKDVMKNLSGIRVLTLEKGSNQLLTAFSNDIKTLFKEDKYSRILHVKDGNETVAIYAVKGNKGFNELGLVVTEPGESVLIYLTGQNMNLGSLSALDELDGMADVGGQF